MRLRHVRISAAVILLHGFIIGITYGESDASQRISLSGTDWRIHEDADGKGVERGMPQADPCDPGWIPANVPGNIQADVEAARLIKPISYGAGDPRLAQIAEKDWWYRKDFRVPDAFAGKRVRLVFDGVDQDCEIWLNGKRLGRNSGMFRRFGFDVAALVQPGKPNRLAVKIDRMPPPVAPAMLGADRHDDTCRDIDTMIHHLNELKSPTNAAYDWSIAVYTLGIWKDVRLEASGPARIEWTQVRTGLKNNDSTASVRVRLDVDSLAGMKARASLRVSGQSADVTKWVAINLTAGGNIVEAELDVASPALWWPNGHGQQPLYELQASLLTESGEILDSRKVRFGIREIRWAQDAEAATRAPYSLGNSLQLVVNGRPVRQMGSNILPPDMLFGRILQRGPRLIQLAKAVGMNTLRVWGGGVILPDEMYDLADELGMLELKPPAKTALGPLLIEMQLHDAAGKLLAERLHVFGPATAKDPLGGLLRNVVPDDDADPLQEGPPEICRPVRRTSLQVKALPLRLEAGQEVLELVLENTGAMTALFCEPHPLIEYRTDLFIDNNHCFIPPGESRTLTIKAADKPRGGLTLAETGWRITTWNADDLVVEPGSDVLLAVGRRDQMCREYLGYFDTSKIKDTGETTRVGTRPDPSQVPCLLDSNHALRCEFPLSEAQAKQAARLRIHTADQAATMPTKVAITMNGRQMEESLPLGLGIQRTDPAHLAFPATVEFDVPAADLRPGKNTLEVRVQDDGWFSWDAMDITSNKSEESTNDR